MADTRRKNRFGSGNGGDISAAIRQNTEAQSRAALQNGTLPVWKGPSPSKSGTGATAGNAASLPGSDAFQPKEKTTLGDVLSNPMYYAEKVVSAPLDALQSGLKDMFSGTKKQEARLNTNQQMQEAATPSKAKLAEGTIVKGADQAVSGITATLDWLIGNPLKSLGWESNPISEWNKYVQTNKEANEVYYAKNLANGSKAQKIVDEYGSATVAAIPQAIVAMMTAGSSLGAQGAGALTAGGTQLAGAEATAAASAAMNASKVASAANTIRNVTTTMAKDKNFWASFAQVAGQGYQDAKADGASEWEANMFALTNGLCNAAIEVGGGIQTLPVELQAGKKGLRAWITSAAEEGQEEVVQGVLERALQNLVYDRGNPIASVSDENAVLNPVTSAKEFAGGFVVGGVLGGGQTLASKALTPSAGRGKTAGVRGAVAGQSAIDRQINYSLVELGLNYAEGSKSRAIAEDMAAKLDAAEDMTKSGVTAKDYGRLLRTMQSEQSARPDLSHKTTARVVNEDGKVVTQMSSVAEAFCTHGDTAPVAVEKAQILERMMSGEQVSNKQLESLGLRDSSTQAVLTQLTGVEVPKGATNSQLRQVFRAAAETAVEAKKAEQALGRSVAQAQVAVEKAQAENAARADEAAASLMQEAQTSVAQEAKAAETSAEGDTPVAKGSEADRGVMVRDGQYISREDFLEYAENYLKERGLPATPEQVEALYERMKQYNTDNGPLVASEEAKAENAFSVDDTADATPVREPGSATKEQQWTARLVADSLQHLGVKAVVFDGAKLGSANAMIADGMIYLNEHKLGSQRMITWAIGHELVHPGANSDANLVNTIIGAFDKLSMSGALTETMQSQVDNLDAIIAEKTDVYKRYLVQERGMTKQQADKIVTEDYVREEIAADWMGEVFASQNTLERLAGIEPGLVTKALRALANIRAHGETALLKGGKDNSTATRRLDGLEQRLKSALERAEMTSRAPTRPEAESIDTAGKTAYNENVEGESQTAEKTQSTTTAEKPKASPELQSAIERLTAGEDVSREEIDRIPEVAEVRALPKMNTADIQTPERQKLRSEVLEQLYQRGSYSSETHDYTGEIAQERRADIVIGAPAAGKSSVLVDPLSEQHKSRVIDSDDAKKLLPEYDDGKGAGNVHRESSMIRNDLLVRAVENGDNLVWPTVGDKLDKLLRDIQNFRDNGYSVYLHLNELSASKATGRALGRYLSEGRFVDPEVVLKVGDKPTQNYNYIRQQEGLIDGYSHYSNDVPRGEKPILYEAGDAGRPLEGDRGRGVRQPGRSLGDARAETEGPRDGKRYSIDSADYRGREDAGRTDRAERRAGAELDEASARARGDGSGDLAVHDRELTEAVRRRATDRDVPDLGLRETADYEAFSKALDAARTANRNGAMVDPQSVEELTEHGAKTFLNGDGTAGVAVERDGNIVGVFKNPSNHTRKAAQDLLLNAIAAGGDHLDCYVLQPEVSQSNLGDIYAQLGFEPVAYLRFNREYADPSWDYDSFGEPDVVMWVHNGDSVGTVVERIGDYHYYTPEEIRETCKEFTDYDEAKAYQKEQLEKRKTAQASEDAGAVSVSGDLRYSVGDFSEQVDKALNGEWDRYNALYVGETSPLMEELGLKQLPVLMTSKHLNDIVAEKSSSDRRKHGLTPDQVKSLGGILSDPAMVLDSAQRNDAIVFVSDQTDADGLPIVAAIRPNGSGVYEMTSQPTNFLLSMYGRENFDKFIESAARDGRILYVNKIKSQSLLGDAGVQFATGLSNADSDGIVHQSRNVVNTEAKEAPAKNPDERFSVDSDTQADLDRVFDSDDFRAFLSDFYSGYGSAETGTTTDTTQRVSRVRSNTLEQSRRESAARMLGEERGKAIDRILTMEEKHLDEMSPEKYTYDVETEKQSMSRAKERLAQDYDGTKAALENGVWRSGEDLDAAMGVLASELAEARRTGNYDEAVEWAHLIQEQGTGAGQFIHAFAKYTRSPEGVLVRAAETLDEAGVAPKQRDELLDRIADFTKTLGAIETGDKNAMIQLILDQAEQRNTKVSKITLRNLGLQKFEYLYDAALNQMDQIAKDYVKPSVGKKISTYQTIAHLLNLRTGLRNIGSNQIFDLVDSAANNISLLPDVIFGAFTGRRTVGFEKSWASKAKRSGAREGLRRSWIEASLDIAPDAANSRDKYGTARRTWKMTGNKGAQAMSTLEKAMGFELNVTDEFHKGSVTAETLESLARAVERGDITQEEAEMWAREEALYRSFQDDTFVGIFLGNLKNLFNTIGVGKSGKKLGKANIKEFGLGDLVQKYTQVPGALITRTLEFSPVGYLKALYNTAQFVKATRTEKAKISAAEEAQMLADEDGSHKQRNRRAREAFRAKNAAEDARVEANKRQRVAALAFGRAITGTGLIMLFTMLAGKGILRRADDEDDADAKVLKAAEGISGTQLNVSALGRWIEGESPEWQTGDDLMSVEFLEPLNALMTIGALVAKDNVDASFWEKVGNYGGDSMEALYQSILEIPTMQTIQTVQSTVQYHDEDGALPLWAEIPFEVARGSVTGFIPSPIRQAAQASDEVYRETYGDKNIWNQTKSSVQNSMPGARNRLDPKLDNFGQAKKLESTARNVLNAFVNPGSLRTYRQSTVSKELDRVYAATDDANIYPDRNAPYTTSYTQDGKKKDFKLTADERQAYQRSRGQTTYRLMQDVMNDPVYKHLSAEDRGEVLTQVKGYSNYVAKKEFLSAHGESYSDDKYEKYSAALQTGMTLSQYLTAKDAVDEAEGVIDPKTGKTKSGTKMADAIEIIDGFDLTPEQKDFMLRSKYPTTKKKVRWH
jgi:hypothetical protein